ncbi:MAG: protein jag [Clostridia bacterium]|nr:protein jag [Clostridia bacterium]
MEEKNVFTAKTVEEALDEGLKALGLTLAEADYEVIEEGKKKLFGSVKAKVRIIPKLEEGKRAIDFIDGLLSIMGIKGESEVVSDSENLTINIKTENSARVIGKRGDVLDAIQCMAGAVANIGRDEYKKVVVDCENYRAQREQTLKELAQKLAKNAVETGRKMILEPMTPYERRIIHAALIDNTEVKTVSEGREPARFIVVIPNNAKPYDKGVRFGGRRENSRGGRRGDRRDRGERREGGREGNYERRDRGSRPSGGAKRGKKEIHFGTFLGNSNDIKPVETPDKKEEE